MVNIQVFQFMIFILDGIIIGTLFDLFRVLRKCFKTKDFLTNIEDIIFWILVGIIFIFTMYNYCSGELRLFMILGLFWGIAIYLVLISKYFIKILAYVINILKNVISFCFGLIRTLMIIIFRKSIYPFLLLSKKIIFRPISLLYKKIRENFKNYLKNVSKNKKKRGDFLKKRRNI